MSLNIRIHIAILVCDTPIQPILRKYGDYFAMFQELLEQGFKDLYSSEAEPHEVTVEFSKYQIVDSNQFPDLGNVDAVLLTGSSTLPFFTISEEATNLTC